ncbi:MAG: hypothetical protein KA248_02775 [Kiritimatiellae bacterium]|nr:hypothetical protein [Kiritimatiellia bacterium]
MKRPRQADQKTIVEQWKRAAPALQRARDEELRNTPYDWTTVDALLDIGAKAPRNNAASNGLVEMQRIFMKGARRMGKLPSSVLEAQAAYGSDIPADKRQALRGFLGARAPAGLFHLGRVDILESSLAAFFCSARCPGALILKAVDLARRWRSENRAVIGGFHTPVEKEVLTILLRSAAPVCMVLARGLPQRIPVELRRPMNSGRLLLVTPFEARVKRATRDSAAFRNQVTAALADEVVVGYAAPGSRTEELCRILAATGKARRTFDDRGTGNLKALGFTTSHVEES